MDFPKRGRKDFEKQMLKHMFSTFLLWYISKHKTYGYELMKKLEGEEGFRITGPGQLYPLLKEMTRNGLISQRRELQGRRARKMYSITADGKDALREAKRCMRENPLKRQFLLEMVG